jgi:hypothetical protein
MRSVMAAPLVIAAAGGGTSLDFRAAAGAGAASPVPALSTGCGPVVAMVMDFPADSKCLVLTLADALFPCRRMRTGFATTAGVGVSSPSSPADDDDEEGPPAPPLALGAVVCSSTLAIACPSKRLPRSTSIHLLFSREDDASNSYTRSGGGNPSPPACV